MDGDCVSDDDLPPPEILLGLNSGDSITVFQGKCFFDNNYDVDDIGKIVEQRDISQKAEQFLLENLTVNNDISDKVYESDENSEEESSSHSDVPSSNVHSLLPNACMFSVGKLLTLESCGYIYHSELTRYERFLLSMSPELLSEKLSCCLFDCKSADISNHQAFVLFLLRNIAMNPHVASATSAQRTLESLLLTNAFQSVVSLKDIYDVFLNCGVDVSSLCPVSSMFSSLTEAMRREAAAAESDASHCWPVVNQHGIFSVLIKIIGCCNFSDSELIEIFLLLLWMSIDSELYKTAEIILLIKECIALVLERLSEEKWKSVELMNGIISFKRLNCSNVLVQVLSLLPVNTFRGQYLQKHVAFSALSSLLDLTCQKPISLASAIPIVEKLSSRNFLEKPDLLLTCCNLLDFAVGYVSESVMKETPENLCIAVKKLQNKLNNLSFYARVIERFTRLIYRVQVLYLSDMPKTFSDAHGSNAKEQITTAVGRLPSLLSDGDKMSEPATVPLCEEEDDDMSVEEQEELSQLVSDASFSDSSDASSEVSPLAHGPGLFKGLKLNCRKVRRSSSLGMKLARKSSYSSVSGNKVDDYAENTSSDESTSSVIKPVCLSKKRKKSFDTPLLEAETERNELFASEDNMYATINVSEIKSGCVEDKEYVCAKAEKSFTETVEAPVNNDDHPAGLSSEDIHFSNVRRFCKERRRSRVINSSDSEMEVGKNDEPAGGSDAQILPECIEQNSDEQQVCSNQRHGMQICSESEHISELGDLIDHASKLADCNASLGNLNIDDGNSQSLISGPLALACLVPESGNGPAFENVGGTRTLVDQTCNNFQTLPGEHPNDSSEVGSCNTGKESPSLISGVCSTFSPSGNREEASDVVPVSQHNSQTDTSSECHIKDLISNLTIKVGERAMEDSKNEKSGESSLPVRSESEVQPCASPDSSTAVDEFSDTLVESCQAQDSNVGLKSGSENMCTSAVEKPHGNIVQNGFCSQQAKNCNALAMSGVTQFPFSNSDTDIQNVDGPQQVCQPTPLSASVGPEAETEQTSIQDNSQVEDIPQQENYLSDDNLMNSAHRLSAYMDRCHQLNRNKTVPKCSYGVTGNVMSTSRLNQNSSKSVPSNVQARPENSRTHGSRLNRSVSHFTPHLSGRPLSGDVTVPRFNRPVHQHAPFNRNTAFHIQDRSAVSPVSHSRGMAAQQARFPQPFNRSQSWINVAPGANVINLVSSDEDSDDDDDDDGVKECSIVYESLKEITID